MSEDTEFMEALRKFIISGNELSEKWYNISEELQEDTFNTYPSYLPSFDEFMADFMEFETDVEDSRVSRVKEIMEKRRFKIIDTGGSCTAYGGHEHDGVYLIVTDTEGGNPPKTMDSEIIVGVNELPDVVYKGVLRDFLKLLESGAGALTLVDTLKEVGLLTQTAIELVAPHMVNIKDV